MQPYRAVCFDFDYTLADATDSIVAGFQHGFTQMGWPAPDRETVRGTIGYLLEDAYTMLTGDSDPVRRAQFRPLFLEVAKERQRRETVLFPGAEELLRTLQYQSYANSYSDGLTYTDAEIQDTYNADPKTYDRVSWEYVIISGAAESTTDADGNTVQPTDEESAAAKDAAKASADKIYKEWQSGAKTEDSFAALAKEKSKDTGSAADGGLISGITSSANYVESFRNWAIDSSRKVGDTGIVESEYGYHIMYYSGSDYAWKSAIRSTKASEDFEKQLTELEGSDEYKLNKKDKNIDKAVKDFLKTFKQRLAMSNSTAKKSSH